MVYKGSLRNQLPALRHKLYNIDKRKRKLRFEEYRMQRHIEYLDILYKRSRKKHQYGKYRTHNVYEDKLLDEISATATVLSDVQDELYYLFGEEHETQTAIRSIENPMPPEVADELLENDEDPFIAQEVIDWDGPEWIDPL